MGKPRKYTPELAAQICDALKTGKTLRAVCRADETLPAEASIREWVRDDRNGFASQYLRAREIGYLAMADELAEISDDGSNDTYTDEDGNEKTNWDVLGRSKLRVDTRKWLLSKALPKIFGDKLDLNHSGEIKNGMSEDTRERRLSALLERVEKRIAQNNGGDDVSDLA